jgi:hypothetical protein
MFKAVFRAAAPVFLIAAICSGPLLAQEAPAAAGRGGRGPGRGDGAPTGPAPKNAEGKPDISGAWAPNAIRQNVDLVATGVTPPFQPWAEKVYTEHKTNISKEDPEARCLPPGVPRMSTTPYPFRIMQTPGLTLIVYEGGAHIWRQIFTDGRPHDKDPNPSWLGDSIGKWDGDTLVVDTIGFNGKTWLDLAGHPTSDQLHIVERYSRPIYGQLKLDITIEDPPMYTKPWNVTELMPLMPGDNLLEYVCAENERDVPHLVPQGK